MRGDSAPLMQDGGIPAQSTWRTESLERRGDSDEDENVIAMMVVCANQRLKGNLEYASMAKYSMKALATLSDFFERIFAWF